jgi:hypothetical protein
MITAARLIELGFEKKEISGSVYYAKDDYILKSELVKWLTCANHEGIIITTLLVIATEQELEKHYLESTSKNLK